MTLCDLLALKITTTVSRMTVLCPADRQHTQLMALPELIRHLSNASIMADVAMTPQSATSFRAGLRTALWAIVPVEVADKVVAA